MGQEEKGDFRLDHPQQMLETAIGNIRAAARVHQQRGQHEKAVRLARLALEAEGIRDPRAAEYVRFARARRVAKQLNNRHRTARSA